MVSTLHPQLNLHELGERGSGLMSSEDRTGSFLAALSAARPAGRILELGTGAGEGTAWLLSGMDPASRLTTVELDPGIQAVARERPRLRRHLAGQVHPPRPGPGPRAFWPSWTHGRTSDASAWHGPADR
ncbi:O-methyltransferase [Streptomyces sp. NPDC007901]|uniref:O-methyltransferase n=1 Tax=Streptomyces sp. NPDC007901 TaxID=3364785 RepID=UPI0036E4B4F7